MKIRFDGPTSNPWRTKREMVEAAAPDLLKRCVALYVLAAGVPLLSNGFCHWYGTKVADSNTIKHDNRCGYAAELRATESLLRLGGEGNEFRY